MGYIRHIAIIVTTWSEPEIEKVTQKAEDIFPDTSKVFTSRVNSYYTLFIPPDGSKLFWEDSDNGIKERDEFIKFLQNETEYCAWVEVQYGDEERNDGIQRSYIDNLLDEED